MSTQQKCLTKLSWLWALSVILIGCSVPERSVPTQTTQQAISTLPLIIETTAVIVESTPAPTSTIPPTLTPTRTLEPSPTTTQTEESQPIVLAEFVSVSPNNEWAAVVINYNRHYAMQVFNQNEGWKQWQVAEKEDSEIRRIAWPLKWSNDEKFLYYTYQFRNGDGCFGYWAFNGSDLHKLDLATGESTQLAPRVGYWIALSPDETHLAYLNSGHIGVLDLTTGNSREAEIITKYPPSILTYPLDIVWSPDGKIFSLVI